MFGFLQDIGHSIQDGAHAIGNGAASVAHGAGSAIGSATQDVNHWLGAPETHDPVTATSANGHAAAAQPTSMWGQLGQGIGDVGRGFSQEGIGGLRDWSGMMDRQQAQRDLAGRFQVMPDGFVGPTRQNQVSQQEYQNIAHTFSDVRTGRGDLHVDASGFDGPNAAAESSTYRQNSMDMIANMMMTGGGRNQINNLSHNALRDDAGALRLDAGGKEQHHATNIVPLFGVAGVDANGRSTMSEAGAGAHTAANLRQDNGYADAVDRSKMLRNADGTRGAGTDVNIRWNPDSNNVGGQGARSDVILAHEMEHTINETQGTMATGQLGGTSGDASFQNWERQAVGLTRSDSPGSGHYPGDPDGCTENTYRQQRNDLGLGERWLPRTSYATLPGQAANEPDLNTAWTAHNSSGVAAP